MSFSADLLLKRSGLFMCVSTSYRPLIPNHFVDTAELRMEAGRISIGNVSAHAVLLEEANSCCLNRTDKRCA
jgi:hypothetical protein